MGRPSAPIRVAGYVPTRLTGLSPDQKLAWVLYSRDAHAFVFGHDGYCPVVTKDEHRTHDAEQPFPDNDNLRVLLDCLLVSGGFAPPAECVYALDWGLPLAHLETMAATGTLFMEKSRQIMASWLCVAYLLWRAKFYPHQLILVQSKREDDAAKFVYVKEPQQARMSFMESRLPLWLQDGLFRQYQAGGGRQFIGAKTSGGFATSCHLYFKNGSHVWAIPEGGDVIRSNTPSCLFSDEAAFQPEFGLAYQAARPALDGGGQGIFVSSAEVGEFARFVEAEV